MALDIIDIELIVDLIPQMDGSNLVLSLGHPDILATPTEIAPFVGGKMLPIDNQRVRLERIGDSREECLGSAFGLFEALGCTLTTLDKRELFGIGDVVDLNNPIPEHHFDKYSLVIDPGTSEHIFNIGQVMSTILQCTMVGGFIYHINPMVMLNHGYWSFSPVTYNDFYNVNGCEVVKMFGRNKKGLFEVPQIKFKTETLMKPMLVCIVKKIKSVDRIVWPIQSKYQ